MKKLKSSKFLIAYAKYHFYLISAFFCGLAIFTAVFSLYSLPVEAVFYGFSLTATCFLFIGSFRFVSFMNKHRELLRIREQITLSVDKLPPAKNIIEEDYQVLITILDDNCRLLLSEMDKFRTNTSDYYSLWAHQIKTPIAAIGLLIQSGPGASCSELTSEIARQLLRIEQYVDMVLNYLRIESPSSDMVIARYSLDSIVKQLVRRLSRLFIHGKTKLELQENMGTVLTDEKWLCFVIEQLLTNALKYTPAGTINIYMEDAETLVIQDTGIGIASEDLPRIFEKGYTGYNGRTMQKSTGIGLYLCKMALDRLAHTISVESESGAGTIVKINFHVTKL